MVGFDFFQTAELPAPVVTSEQASALSRDLFGRTGRAQSLGSQQDANFLIDTAAGRHVLKIANPAFTELELLAQGLAAERVAAAEPTLQVPRAVPGVDGVPIQRVRLAGQVALVRLLEFVDGEQLSARQHLSEQLVAELGAMSARVVLALADFDHPGTERGLQWDLRVADRVVEQLAPHVRVPDGVAQVRAAAVRAAAALEPVAKSLPVQVIHGDVTDDNVVVDAAAAHHGERAITGIIDFGDLMRSWAVAELAVACSSVLHHAPSDITAVLPAIRAFHRLRPLSDPEQVALWPLVVLRSAVLVVSGQHQVSLDADNVYAEGALDREWEIFQCAVSTPIPVMTALIRRALAETPPPSRPLPSAFSPLVPAFAEEALTTLDLSVASEDLDDGRFLEPAVEARLAAGHPARGAVATAYGEARLTRTRLTSVHPPATTALGIELYPAQDVSVCAPWDGSVAVDGQRVTLRTADVTLWLTGLAPLVPDGASVARGAALGQVAAAGDPLTIQVTTELTEPPPLLVEARLAPGWRGVCLDPGPLLGRPLAAEPPDPRQLLSRRAVTFAPVQEHYYQRPPQIERGWQNHLFDVDGRSYLDMVNNVSILGHGHPAVADAVARQWRRLNTNSRFNYGIVVEYAERLAALLPAPLDTVFLVNSGTEAVDLALRLAWAATGRRDVVAMAEAYHGWSDATDAISTSVADNPHALDTRPSWVHTVAAANAYRGQYRGAAASRYAVDAVAAIDRLAAQGRPAAAFVAEAFYGNAGGMALPSGYLTQVYAAMRAGGGVCVADEVQVGLGRLGHHFWGFQEQGVVPDIVSVAKGIGNGHPLGAVITTRAIAESYRSQGYFFSSGGGSPVSCAVGSAVLDVLEAEGLPDNARVVGDHLRGRLLELGERHELIGAVHGSGLYLGLELVRDRVSLEPADTETAAICARLLELGVIMQATSDRMCVLKIKPPLGLRRHEADFFVDALTEVLTTGW